RTVTDYLTAKRSSTFNKKRAGTNQIAKTFFGDQTTDRNDQRRIRGKSRASEVCKVQTVVKAMNSIGAFRKALLQELRRIIGFSNDYTRCPNKFIQTNLKNSWGKDIVGMRCEAESDWKKFRDPKSGARRHSSKVRMNMEDPCLLQAQPDINSLIESEKVGATTPLTKSAND